MNQEETSLPVIDLNPMREGTDAGMENVAEQIRNIYTTYGFDDVINHRIPQSLINDVFREAGRFHDLPLVEADGVF